MSLSASLSVARSSPRLGGHEVVASEDVTAAGLEVYVRTGSKEAACRELAENIVYARRERIGASREGADAHFITQATKINGEWCALIAREEGFEVGPPLSRLYRDMDSRLVQQYMESYERAWNNQGSSVDINPAELFSSNRSYAEVRQKVVAHGFEMVQVTHIEVPVAQNGESATAQVRAFVSKVFGPEAIDPSSPTGFKVAPRSDWQIGELHRGIVEHLMERDASIAAEYLRRSESFLKDPILHQKALSAEIDQLTRTLVREFQSIENPEQLARAFQGNVIEHLSNAGVAVSTRPFHISPELAAAFQNKEFEKMQTSLPFRLNEEAVPFIPGNSLDASRVLQRIPNVRDSSFEAFSLTKSGSLSAASPAAAHSSISDSSRTPLEGTIWASRIQNLESAAFAPSHHDTSRALSLNTEHLSSPVTASPFAQLSSPPLLRMAEFAATTIAPVPAAPRSPADAPSDSRTSSRTFFRELDLGQKKSTRSSASTPSGMVANSPTPQSSPLRVKLSPGGRQRSLSRIAGDRSRVDAPSVRQVTPSKATLLLASNTTRRLTRAASLQHPGSSPRASLQRATWIRAAMSIFKFAPRGGADGGRSTAASLRLARSPRNVPAPPHSRGGLRDGITQLMRRITVRGLTPLALTITRLTKRPHSAARRVVTARGELSHSRQSLLARYRATRSLRTLPRSLPKPEAAARLSTRTSPRRTALILMRQLERALSLKRSASSDRALATRKLISKTDLRKLPQLVDRRIALALRSLTLLREGLTPLQVRTMRALLRISKARLTSLDSAALISLNEALDEFLHRPIRRTRHMREHRHHLRNRERRRHGKLLTEGPYAVDDFSSETMSMLDSEPGEAQSIAPSRRRRSGALTQGMPKHSTQSGNSSRPAATSATAILTEEAPSNELTTQRLRLKDTRDPIDQPVDSSDDSPPPSPYSLSL